ncbi:MAG: DUF424 family protein [Candidatus Pacearchaeota archaeon]|jgi:hypothetical protein|nr:hypothetical protein [Candidatus Pacearchaeota archaeon]MDP7520660.1 DUF424 family protein [Candidatus Pacearchaeota archaeon]|tara:strand:+ start:724 stop:1020 length:297 start_codon:yes stop_codon:yes gene_type:complete
MFVNIIKTYRDIVAICDSNLIGKKFEEGEFQLDIKESFFKGKEESVEKVRRIMTDMIKEDATFNIVGENSIKTALDEGIISKEGIREIQGIPFALILK